MRGHKYANLKKTLGFETKESFVRVANALYGRLGEKYHFNLAQIESLLATKPELVFGGNMERTNLTTFENAYFCST